MIGIIGLVGHGVAAFIYAVLAIWHLGRGTPTAQQRVFGGAFAATALWCVLMIAGTLQGFTPGPVASPLTGFAGAAECLRNLMWLTFVILLFQDSEGVVRRQTLVTIYTLLVAALMLGVLLGFARALAGIDEASLLGSNLLYIGLALRILIMAGGLLLLHNLYNATVRAARWSVRGPLIAIGIMWAWDLNLYTVTYLFGRWPATLLALRGPLMLALVVPFALASRRQGPWRLSLSRIAAFQSVSLLAIGSYLIFMVLATQAMALVGGQNIRLAQFALVMIMSAAAALLLPSARVRAWLKVKIAKHFFAHRYDYREEWLRFTGTLGRAGGSAAPLEQRVIKAIADITESPGGLLLIDSGAGDLVLGTRWNWPTAEPPALAGTKAFVSHLERTGRILELDVLRGDDPADDAERALMPSWLLAEGSAWIAVPLLHLDRLIGVVVTERPRIDRLLDWEDFDLLKVAGRQVATYLAEARTQEALSEAARFDEFNRRFAFILHDIKNLVSQLSLVARNAERHADNPAFRADMVATLQSSVGKMNALLALLSTQNRVEPAAPRPLPLLNFVQRVAETRRDSNPIHVEGEAELVALADPARLEQALVHIIQNAVDASEGDRPVNLVVGTDGGRATILVKDQGKGMSADFIRSGLFKPFSSTKANGFGVGAFEARTLLMAMGGALEVESRLGEGSRFTLILPLVGQAAMDKPATAANG
ncbi:XrtA/PEP-CTERM system histidine kinase PrsK [Sphingomonas quercus]|uniref:PEP-CTERM system histidine kinase PrsK n=1 Tax=Sphingomonas quercus TaxID=2842451 RepID=A0ABS6BID0_9SPHN|nr:XrtA/PEP-CTERM system histidine kinase PrsK [Sphingomonas quercus]MBU3078062.1 PEP-CTERM system histidine kinase PrsK [Sphingomonas quercus]